MTNNIHTVCVGVSHCISAVKCKRVVQTNTHISEKNLLAVTWVRSILACFNPCLCTSSWYYWCAASEDWLTLTSLPKQEPESLQQSERHWRYLGSAWHTHLQCWSQSPYEKQNRCGSGCHIQYFYLLPGIWCILGQNIFILWSYSQWLEHPEKKYSNLTKVRETQELGNRHGMNLLIQALTCVGSFYRIYILHRSSSHRVPLAAFPLIIK